MSRWWMTTSLLLLAACGSSAPEPTGTDTLELRRTGELKRVDPSAVTLAPGQTQGFSVVPGSTAVTWTVAEPGGGSVTAAGIYTAPATAGIYTVVATSATSAVRARVTVASPAATAVQITAPSPVAVDACGTATLGATVTGTADTGVLWSLQDPACGMLAQDGRFTAARWTGACVAVAAARADPTRTAQVTLQVSERVLAVSVDPATVATPAASTQQLTASVTTTCGSFPATQ